LQKFDVVVLGAGASGLMCAAQAGYRGLKVLVIDHAPKMARKIRISGGGKANFTNITVSADNFICRNPHFVKSALAQYSSQDFIDLVERHGLEYEQREQGKLFCQNSASDLIQILRTECNWAGCYFWLNTTFQAVIFENKQYQLSTSRGLVLAENLVVATGGLSFPKLKSTNVGYSLAKQFGLPVVPASAGLVPLNFKDKYLALCQHLSGIALNVKVSVVNKPEPSFTEAMLFTHQGLSGPAILQISNYWQLGEGLEINLLPQLNVEAELLQLKAQNSPLSRWLKEQFPKNFYQSWLELYPMEASLANVSHETVKQYAKKLTQWQLYPSAKAGYDKAEVTLGGVDTDHLQSKDGQVKNQKGLYFIGEVVDVTGHLGGYNFQWAWSSAYTCGTHIQGKK
jgi:predicted Rossmann fold flavoprotein